LRQAKKTTIREYFGLNLKRRHFPEQIAENKVAVAYFGQCSILLETNLVENVSAKEIAAEIALKIDEAYRKIVFEHGKPIIDWQNNRDMEGCGLNQASKVRNKIRLQLFNRIYKIWQSEKH